MAEPRELGPLLYIAAEAIGQPGQRRFRLKAMTPEGVAAFLWLEKEQLSAVAEAIENVLKAEEYENAGTGEGMAEEPVFPLNAEVDFRVGQLSMGINRETNRIVLVGVGASEAEEPEGVSLEFDYGYGVALQRQIREVVAAGRAPCPLCGAPLDPQGHVCPRSNGHHEVSP